MTTYGVTPNGFIPKPESAILADVARRQRTYVADDLDVSPESDLGKINAIYAREIAFLWEQLGISMRSTDPDQAEDDLLEQVCKLTGTERRSASYSTVELSCDLNDGAVLATDVAYAAVNGDPTNLWTPAEEFTAPSAGTHLVEFRSTTPGPVTANNTTITVIHAPVSGWNSCTNPEGAIPGRPIDSDATLRLRREQQLANAGSATTRAIRADVLEVSGVEYCRVFENTTSEVDENGLPPHSIEVLIYDGEGEGMADNAEVAQAIFDARAGGVGTFGEVTANAIDELGEEKAVKFTRATQLPVYVSITVEKVEDQYNSDEHTAAYIVAKSREFYGLGDTVRARQLDSVAFELAGVEDVTAFTLGLGTSPVGTGNIPIGIREIATFDTSRVVVASHVSE